MAGWSGLDYALLAMASFVAVTMLVRMMSARRRELLDELSRGAGRSKAKPRAGRTVPDEQKHAA